MNDFMEKYLGEVDRRLRRLPVAERVDIVNELKSEIADCLVTFCMAALCACVYLLGLGSWLEWIRVLYGIAAIALGIVIAVNREVIRRSDVDSGIRPVYGEQLLTLSTCEYSSANGRYVVVARRIA